MGKTVAEKILARKSGRVDVQPGDIVFAEPDMAVLVDALWPIIGKEFRATGAPRVWNSDKMVLVIDHTVPGAISPPAVDLHNDMRQFCRDQGIRLHDVGRHGISHQLAAEMGYARPGTLYTGDDGHATTLGATGALAISLSIEMVAIMVTGRHWFRVPETWLFRLEGQLQPGVMARDAIQRILGDLGNEGAQYKMMEFGGPALKHLSMDDRLTLCSLAPNVGAKTAVVPPDEITVEYLKHRTQEHYEMITSDPDAVYERRFSYDLSRTSPQVAVPPDAFSSVSVEELAEVRIDQASVGSCAGARLDDLRAAAAVLKGRKIAPGVRFYITPSSQEVYAQAAREGLLEIFVDAEAVVSATGCAPCYGYLAQLDRGEVCIASHTVNYQGRMGHTEAQIYLGSAATVAASAVAGRITDPRRFLA